MIFFDSDFDLGKFGIFKPRIENERLLHTELTDSDESNHPVIYEKFEKQELEVLAEARLQLPKKSALPFSPPFSRSDWFRHLFDWSLLTDFWNDAGFEGNQYLEWKMGKELR